MKNKLPPKAQFWHWWLGGFVAILVCSLLFTLPLFGRVPDGLNRDEAALGYNAYSLLKTGADEFGRPWPVSITSFGDQKLPGYVYTLIPFITLFDLNAASVRLPSLLAGLVVIAATGFLALQIGKKIYPDQKLAIGLSWLVMILLAASPWHIHFSRVAYEAHLAMALFVSGLCAYTVAIDLKKIWPQRLLIIAAALLWSGTLLTYHSYHIFLPLFVLGLLIVDWRRIKELDRAGLGTGVIVAALAIFSMYAGGVWQANQVKNQGITPFNSISLRIAANDFRAYFPGENSIIERVLFNPVTEGMSVLGQNLVSVVSTPFLFVSGGGNGDHNPGGSNNFHLFVAALLLVGLKAAWDHRDQPQIKRLGVWLLVALIPSALTISPQHTIRFSPAFPVIELFAALGGVLLWQACRKSWQKGLLVVIGIILLVTSVVRNQIKYLYLIPPSIEGHQRYDLLARTIQKYASQGKTVITQSPTSSPYIWYLLDTKYDPALLQQNIERYPADAEGFMHVKRVGNVYFETIQWGDLAQRSEVADLYLVFKPTEVPREKREDGTMQMIEEVSDSYGNLQYQVWIMPQHN